MEFKIDEVKEQITVMKVEQQKELEDKLDEIKANIEFNMTQNSLKVKCNKDKS